MIDATDIVARQIRHDHPDWKEGAVWLEVMRAIVGEGDYVETYRETKKYGRGAFKEGRHVE